MTDTTPADRAAWGTWCLLVACGLQGLALSWPWVDLGDARQDNPLWAAAAAALVLVIVGAVELWAATGALLATSRRLRDMATEFDRERLALRAEVQDLRCQAAGLEGLARSAMRERDEYRLDVRA